MGATHRPHGWRDRAHAWLLGQPHGTDPGRNRKGGRRLRLPAGVPHRPPRQGRTRPRGNRRGLLGVPHRHPRPMQVRQRRLRPIHHHPVRHHHHPERSHHGVCAPDGPHRRVPPDAAPLPAIRPPPLRLQHHATRRHPLPALPARNRRRRGQDRAQPPPPPGPQERLAHRPPRPPEGPRLFHDVAHFGRNRCQPPRPHAPARHQRGRPRLPRRRGHRIPPGP